MADTPSGRTLERLRKTGWIAQSVERLVPMPAGEVYDRKAKRLRMAFFLTVRQDLFNCIDLVGVNPGVAGVLGIQATSGGGIGKSNAAARVRKLLAEPRAKTWLQAGNRLEVWSWERVKLPTKTGGTKLRWEPAITVITLEMFPPETAPAPHRNDTEWIAATNKPAPPF